MSALVAPAELPPALRPWRTWLGWFDVALALQLGELVLRLSDLVGPAPAVASQAALEPDGLDDLRARGTYERLLASEWLLADEIPDEFLRRAAASEHLFLSPRLRSARVERSVVAIFDCGPRQLGAPRLAHLAAWILLARRAAEEGGTLRWGVLQAPGVLHDAAGAVPLRALLEARRLEPGDARQVEAWRAAIEAGEDGAAARETWWIGADADAPLARERRLTLQLAFDAAALDVTVQGRAQARRARLPLPPEKGSTALLRGQFASTRVERPAPAMRSQAGRRLSITKAPLLDAASRIVAVPTLEGHAMQVFALPRPGQAKLAVPRLQAWSSARPPIAAMICGRQVAAICVDSGWLHFWQFEGFGMRPRPRPEDFEASISTANWLPMARLTNGTGQRVCVIDRAHRLVGWDANHRQPGKALATSSAEPRHFDDNVLALLPLATDRLAYAFQYGNGLWLRELGPQGEPGTLRRRLCALAEERPHVLLAADAGPARRGNVVGAVAVRVRAPVESWHVYGLASADRPIDAEDGAIVVRLELGPGERAAGLVAKVDDGGPALLVLGADRRTLQLATARGRRVVHTDADRIAQCTVCPRTGLVAMLTAGRDLVVLDAPTGRPVLAVRDAQARDHDARTAQTPHHD